MLDPVRTPAGHAYERSVLLNALKTNPREPLTRATLDADMLVDATDLRERIAQDPAATWLAQSQAVVRKRIVECAASPPAHVMRPPADVAVEPMHFEQMSYMEQGRAYDRPRVSAARLARLRNLSLPTCDAGQVCHGIFLGLLATCATTPTWGGALGGALIAMASESNIPRGIGTGAGIGAGVNVAMFACVYACCCRR